MQSPPAVQFSNAWVRARALQWHDVWLLGVGEVPAP
jgi:hypothetical protein